MNAMITTRTRSLTDLQGELASFHGKQATMIAGKEITWRATDQEVADKIDQAFALGSLLLQFALRKQCSVEGLKPEELFRAIGIVDAQQVTGLTSCGADERCIFYAIADLGICKRHAREIFELH